MMFDGVVGKIHVAARTQLGLHGGELVSINVIKRLEGNKWAVGINGRVYPAFSRLELQPGSVLRARAAASGAGMVFRIENNPKDAAPMTLVRQGLSGGAVDTLLAASLLRSGLSVTADTVEKMRTVMARSRQNRQRAARGLAVLMDKGFDIAGRASQKLLEVFGFGESGGEDHRKYKKRGLPRGKDAGAKVRSLIARPEGEAGVLSVFNHLKGKNQSWIVVPFLYEEAADEYPGTVKLLYDPYARRPLRMTVSVSPNGGPTVDFHLTLEGKKKLAVFCDDAALRAAIPDFYGDFKANFNNLGFEVDDTIYGSESFDGFTPVWEGASVRGIDTVG
jgi:hypothetical protein